jgi:ORF6N domain-containing protein
MSDSNSLEKSSASFGSEEEAASLRSQIAALKVDTFIHELRGQKVVLDTDLARIYGIPTFRLNEAVKRNRDRFPSQEVAVLASPFAMSKKGRGGRGTLPGEEK